MPDQARIENQLLNINLTTNNHGIIDSNSYCRRGNIGFKVAWRMDAKNQCYYQAAKRHAPGIKENERIGRLIFSLFVFNFCTKSTLITETHTVFLAVFAVFVW